MLYMSLIWVDQWNPQLEFKEKNIDLVKLLQKNISSLVMHIHVHAFLCNLEISLGYTRYVYKGYWKPWMLFST